MILLGGIPFNMFILSFIENMMTIYATKIVNKFVYIASCEISCYKLCTLYSEGRCNSVQPTNSTRTKL